MAVARFEFCFTSMGGGGKGGGGRVCVDVGRGSDDRLG